MTERGTNRLVSKESLKYDVNLSLGLAIEPNTGFQQGTGTCGRRST